MITKVRIKNWRSHLDSELNFSSGTNVLIGIMGSGKTSVTDSICYALFGNFPTLQTRKLKLDEVIMKKPTLKDRAEVEVFFQIGGKTYSVKRIIERGKGTIYSEIKENGKILESPSTQRVTEMVEKILKVNYELFSKAIYSEQNALDYFLTIPRGQRMRKIDELLMIDKFEKARSAAVSVTNKIADRKLGKQSIIEQTKIEEIKGALEKLETSFKDTLSEKISFKENYERIKNEKENLEKQVVDLRKIKENLELLKREESRIKGVLEETKKSLISLEESLRKESIENIEERILKVDENIRQIENKLNEKQKIYEKLNSFISESKVKLEILKKEKIDKLEKDLDEKLKIKEDFDELKDEYGEDVKEKLEEKKKLIGKLIEEIEGTKARIKNLEEILEGLSKAGDKCPVCGSDISGHKKAMLISEKQSKISKLKKKLNEVSKNRKINEEEAKTLEDAIKKLDEMFAEVKDLDEIKTDLEESKKTFKDLSKSTIEHENELSKIRKELETLKTKLKEISDNKQKLEIMRFQYKDYEEKKKRLNELLEDVDSVREKMKKIKDKIVGKNLEDLEKKLKELIAREKELETKISGLEQLIEEKQLRINEYKNKIADVEKQKEEITKLEKIIKDLKIFQKALEQTQIELREEFIEAVNYTMNKIWPTLYPYHDFSGIRLSVEGGDYVLQLQERAGSFVNVEGVASGGERSTACLALRIAFALVLAPQLRMLILDEPTANLDTKSIAELATTLRERISEFIDQTFLITHQSELEDAVTGSLYRLERNKERDDTTRIIQAS